MPNASTGGIEPDRLWFRWRSTEEFSKASIGEVFFASDATRTKAGYHPQK